MKTSRHPVLITMAPKITFEINNGQSMFYAGSVVVGFVTIESIEDLSNVSGYFLIKCFIERFSITNINTFKLFFSFYISYYCK